MQPDEGGRYFERLPRPAIRRWVRTCWVQSAGGVPIVQRNLPTGGMAIHQLLGAAPEFIGPLTVADDEVLPARATLVGIRFWPGLPPLRRAGVGRGVTVPAYELCDRRVALAEVLGPTGAWFGDLLADTSDATRALVLLEDLVEHLLHAEEPDLLVRSAADGLMPWRPASIGAVADRHGLSTSQLRRRFLTSVGLTPKVLQRTLRFQGYLALAQAAAGSLPGRLTTADFAASCGYADQPHLTRECVRLVRATPRVLLGSIDDVCGCGHDHVASYRSFLGAAGGPRHWAAARSVQATSATDS